MYKTRVFLSNTRFNTIVRFKMAHGRSKEVSPDDHRYLGIYNPDIGANLPQFPEY